MGIPKEENLISEMGIQVRFNLHHEGGKDDVIQRRIQETQYRCENHLPHAPVGNWA